MDIANMTASSMPDRQVELCCQDCMSVIEDIRAADGRICPVCGGSLAGISYYRNHLTKKILYAERVEL